MPLSKAEQIKLAGYADKAESELMEVLNGSRKPDRVSTEPIVRLIHYARTGKIRGASIAIKQPESKQ